MNAGKEKCEILKGIRKMVAEQYGLEYNTVECTHKGACPGTCPQCEAELADLKRQLKAKGVTDIDLESLVEIPQVDPLDISLTEGLVIEPGKREKRGFPMDLQGLPPIEGDII